MMLNCDTRDKEGRAFSPFFGPLGSQKSKVTLRHYLSIGLLDE